MEAEDADLARQLRTRDARQRQAAQAEAAVADAQAAAEEQVRVAEQMAQLAERLAAEDYAPAERAELARLQAESAQIGYDAAAHEQVRKELERLAPFDARYQRQLLPALDGDSDARDRVERSRSAACRVARPSCPPTAPRSLVYPLPWPICRGCRPPSTGRPPRWKRPRPPSAARGRNEGAAMQQLSALDALSERRGKLAADLDRLNAEIGVYNQLREAFGKKGLQAMIIESAIPEVETEANRLLSRMTEGRMSLRLETQREKVTGGVAETLDIVISDELGARPYEMYSGGESFRANLALRIAISKLLARRAGAQLQTLVIDEGFGSQDAQGRSLVVEAINSIQHDFERIIVITHIEELKDLFPARIDVVKTASGSRVMIA